mmetsp:Transcript_8111/g.20832  ORF Transcript_8111/g.20832 Transcript_8111/m.20832 type:complete len:256 (+) Transcript_8111:380-1147(+)
MAMLDGRVALVTASTEGIGRAIAKRLASDGAHVVISSRKKDKVDAVVAALRSEGLSVSGMVCHVGKADHRRALVEDTVRRHGKIDIFVSNAAVNPTAEKIFEMSPEAVEKVIDINLKSAVLLYQLVAPHMRGSSGGGSGSIVFISSITAYHPSLPLSLYATCKTALLGLTKAAAGEMAEKKVRVNCIAPGFIPTNFSSALTATEDSSAMLRGWTMLKRLGTPEEVASVCAFLCSEDASYITGETIAVAGGMQSKL